MNTTRLRRVAALLPIVAALSLCAASLRAADAPAKPSGMSSFLSELWGKLRAAGPRSGQATAMQTMTAGVRGTEATESELKPYWKGDREQDPAFRAERDALQAAQALADAGKYAEAAKEFDAFVAAHPQSPLAANAQFGAALARAALGDRARARSGFEAFLKQHPQHVLAGDAEQALAALR